MDWPFRGRQQELERVLGHVRDGVRLVTVTGSAGVGKSALARAALQALGVEPQAVIVLAADSGADSTEPARLLPKAEASPSVIVLDVEPGSSAAASTVRRLLDREPNLSIIAASRTLIGLPAERPVALHPLAVPCALSATQSAEEWLDSNPAAAMFVDRATTVARAFEPDRATLSAVGELCARLKGLPLALHIAALQTSLLPVPAMLDELRFPLDFLDAGFVESDDPSTSLRASISSGLAVIAADELELLRAIAQFPAGCSLRTLRARGLPGLGSHGTNPMPLLSSLVGAGLLNARTNSSGTLTRFELPPFYREFFIEPRSPQPSRALVETLRESTIENCRELSALRGPAWDRTAELLEAEHANLISFIESDRDGGRVDDAAEIVDLLQRFWVHRNHHTEALSYIEEIEQRGALAHASAARLAIAAAIFKAQLTSYTNAHERFVQAIQAWRKTDHRDRLAEALVAFSPAAFEVDGWDAARAALTEAIEIYAELGDEWSLARAQAQLGALAADVPGQTEFARANLNAASSALQALGDVGFASLPLEHLGRMLLDDGEYEQARLVLERGLAEIRAVGDRFHESAYLNLLGLSQLSLGNAAKATHRFLDSLRIAVDLGLKARAVWCLEGLRDTMRALSAPETARLCSAYAVELREQLDLRGWVEACSPNRVPDSESELPRAISMAITGAAAWPPTPVLQKVPLVLSELAERGARAEPLHPGPRPDGLTAREIEILSLVAAGMTSRAIANRLVISIDTVGRHITNLYRKIGARGRAEATAYAIRHGLHAQPQQLTVSGD
ncbi:LuxR C-terminal-related transcriptional regulator [Ruicaihuangia caeni]|uniref:LuxR C-terminal-related transcriptional regulator n=1 Tax=Ruicaihuangia caeni TaxID=3042517 RepID=A0AAW6TDS7_9MICO|nr:LuxR C-terminal-related transcriptional regulator [Klugiella sp. YN-L-19]MDI2099227.1 LuxR C-terminal-related transcriptional regulator [Klugiella sp. YN-L-19]